MSIGLGPMVLMVMLGSVPLAVPPVPEAGPSGAGERLAVLILPARGTASSLADNLTEVVLARVADRRMGQVVGTAEFRRRLGMNGDSRASACLDDVACLGSVGVVLGVKRVVTGTVRAEANDYLVNLVLTDLQSAKVVGRFFRHVHGTVDDLVAAVQEGTDELFRPRPEPGRLRIDSEPPGARVNVDGVYLGTTPMISGPLIPGSHPVRVEREGHFPWATSAQVAPGTDLEIKLMPWQMPRRRRWPGPVVAGALIGAGSSVGLGATLGTLSQVTPMGTTRRDVQDELNHQHALATSANVAFGAGAALALAALVIYVVYRKEDLDD